MSPLEKEETQALVSEEQDARSGLNPELQIVLFDTMDIIEVSDPNAGTWV